MLLYFCWRDDGILYSRGAVIQRTIEVSPAFFKHVSAEKKKCEHMQTEHAGGWIFFEAAQNFVHQIYSRVKNQKTYYVGS